MKFQGSISNNRLGRKVILLSILAILSIIVSAILMTTGDAKLLSGEIPEDAPAIEQPTPMEVQGYTVPSKQPRYLYLDEGKAAIRIMPLGVTSRNRLQSPANVHDVGWYKKSSLPGEPGAMIIDGHVSSWTTKGVFYDLEAYKIGDRFQLERGDGKRFTYEVQQIKIYEASSVDMGLVQKPINSSAPGLNLITCTGKVIEGTSEFSHRLVVFTKQI